jgi:lysozyme family protein
MKIEGAFWDAPAGGPTKYGVSLKAHTAGIGDRDGDGDVDADDVQMLGISDAENIFRAHYWDPVWADRLPPALALVMADMAYHHGVPRSIRIAQAACNALGCPPGAFDGKMGPRTLGSLLEAFSRDDFGILAEISRFRLSFMQGLPNWMMNKNGWERRVFRIAVAAGDLSSWAA